MTLYLEKIAESQKNEYKAMLVYSEMNVRTLQKSNHSKICVIGQYKYGYLTNAKLI